MILQRVAALAARETLSHRRDRNSRRDQRQAPALKAHHARRLLAEFPIDTLGPEVLRFDNV
jgi:hypothetical protein